LSSSVCISANHAGAKNGCGLVAISGLKPDGHFLFFRGQAGRNRIFNINEARPAFFPTTCSSTRRPSTVISNVRGSLLVSPAVGAERKMKRETSFCQFSGGKILEPLARKSSMIS